MQGKTLFFGILAIILVFAATQSFFIVDERQQAIKLFLGAPDGDPDKPETFIKGPGLHFKIPLLHKIRYFDRRILSVDPPPAQVVIASASLIKETLNETDAETAPEEDGAPGTFENVSGEPIIVDTFARYKINDPLQFLKKLTTVVQAESRLENVLNSETRSVLGKTSLRELLSDERTAVMRDIQERVNTTTEEENFGIEIVDVRIVRADLTSDLRASTVRRMISELKERATETRAKGEERALEIRSTANKEREILIAEAQRDSEILRGEGDKEAIQIYAEAFQQDEDFYAFYRSLQAYRNSLATPETTLLLSPENEFFDYFNNLKARE